MCSSDLTVRHPAAFASSLKRLNWPFDFNHLLSQAELMRDWLEPFRPQMLAMIDQPEDIIGQASLLWCMVYYVVQQYQQKIPGLITVRHEDLSMDPIGGFMQLYDHLGLHFTQDAREMILTASSSENPKELSKKKVHTVRLDSRANIDNWKHRLQKDEIERVREFTIDIARLYYPEESWE